MTTGAGAGTTSCSTKATAVSFSTGVNEEEATSSVALVSTGSSFVVLSSMAFLGILIEDVTSVDSRQQRHGHHLRFECE